MSAVGPTQRPVELVLRSGRESSPLRMNGAKPPLLRVPVCTEWFTVLFTSQHILLIVHCHMQHLCILVTE